MPLQDPHQLQARSSRRITAGCATTATEVSSDDAGPYLLDCRADPVYGHDQMATYREDSRHLPLPVDSGRSASGQPQPPITPDNVLIRGDCWAGLSKHLVTADGSMTLVQHPQGRYM